MTLSTGVGGGGDSQAVNRRAISAASSPSLKVAPVRPCATAVMRLLQASWQFERVVRPGLAVKRQIFRHVRTPVGNLMPSAGVHGVARINVASGQGSLKNFDVGACVVVLRHVQPDARL